MMLTGIDFDIYLQFAASGDYYLGELLTIKDQNSVDFDTLHPCWTDPNAPILLDVLYLMFGWINKAHSDSSHDPLAFYLYIHFEDSRLPLRRILVIQSALCQSSPLICCRNSSKSCHFDFELTCANGDKGFNHTSHSCNRYTVKEVCEKIETKLNNMRENLKTIVHEVIDKG